MKVTLQGTPENIDKSTIEGLILSVNGVQSVYDLHLWTMDREYNIMTAHVVVGQDVNILCLKK